MAADDGQMKSPVLHDDQHGTAIVAGAALINALALAGKEIGSVRVAACGVGRAGLACLDMMVLLGVAPRNILAADSTGVLHAGRRDGVGTAKARYVRHTAARTLADIVRDADVFLGCSTGALLGAEMACSMAGQPLILALSNPEPEIRPEAAAAVRPDSIVATCLPDYPNQVSNLLCLPFIFRGASDCGATRITDAMRIACVHAIADLARTGADASVTAVYPGEALAFGRDYIIPRPFDPRLPAVIATCIAQTAMTSKVATRPVLDLEVYRDKLAEGLPAVRPLC